MMSDLSEIHDHEAGDAVIAELEATIASLGLVNKELADALEGARLGLEAVQRNKQILIDALNRSGMPSAWLAAIDTKMDRINAALRNAGRAVAI